MAPLKVIIVGGGFSGMVAARVLREYHDVTVLERSPRQHSHGSGINLGPSAMRILEELGFSRERAKSVIIERFRKFDRFGGLLQDDSMRAVSDRAGARWHTQEWVDGWNELMRLAAAPSEELGISGKPPTFIWGAKVVAADVEKGEVEVADGRKFQADLIVGADGINSLIRRQVVGGDDQFLMARRTGSSAYRLTLTASEVEAAAGKVRVMDSKQPATLDLYIAYDGTRRAVIMYPCREFELLNINCVAPDDWIHWLTPDAVSAPADPENLANIFSDFGPVCRNLLGVVKGAKVYQLRDEEPISSYVKGCTVLIGDAAHGMTPHQGQASSQSVEDAEAFRLLNREDIDRSEVPDILKDIDRVRRPRATQVQKQTRAALTKVDEMGLLKHMLYNWEYPGVHECLRRLNNGEQMLHVTNPFATHWTKPPAC